MEDQNWSLLSDGHDGAVGISLEVKQIELTENSAAIAAIVKTTKLYQLADLADFTCTC